MKNTIEQQINNLSQNNLLPDNLTLENLDIQTQSTLSVYEDKKLSDPNESIEEIPIYTVSNIAALLRNIVNKNFSGVSIRGEISNLKIASSGHAYFSLKDSGALLNAICWKSVATKSQLREGMEVICQGDLAIYPERSLYQLIVKNVESTGVGGLLALLEKRKQQFALEGLFLTERKKQLPLIPKVIAIITSLQGAVIKDILHRISQRFPLSLLIWGVNVQGNEAAAQVAEAIKGLNDLASADHGSVELDQYGAALYNHNNADQSATGTPRPDVIIIARGGGSIEDLWAFNEEILVRTAAASAIPIISAIGHETDYTLLDFVADYRAPTPTAAAEKAVPVRADLKLRIDGLLGHSKSLVLNMLHQQSIRLHACTNRIARSVQYIDTHILQISRHKEKMIAGLSRNMQLNGAKLDYIHKQLSPRLLENMLAIKQQQLDDLCDKMQSKITLGLDNISTNLENLGKLLHSYSYQKVMERGFSVLKVDGKVIKSIADVNEIARGQLITAEICDGQFNLQKVE